jgi:two-component system, NarL family, nitrate/nitrite response regulator NarL
MDNSQTTAYSPNTSLLIIDGHRIFREFMVRFLNSSSGRFLISITGRSDEGISLAGTLQPQIILLDLSMSIASGLAMIPDLRRAAPTARIIALTFYNDFVSRDDALRAGAHDFVSKQDLGTELMPAIEHHLSPCFAPSQQRGIST